jgi:hypothetical protein
MPAANMPVKGLTVEKNSGWGLVWKVREKAVLTRRKTERKHTTTNPAYGLLGPIFA